MTKGTLKRVPFLLIVFGNLCAIGANGFAVKDTREK